MTKLLAAATLAATLALPFASAPAYANHTLCDNESTDTWVGALQIGADTDDAPGTVYICNGYELLVIRLNGPITYCSYFDWHDPSTADCVYIG